MKTKDIGLMLGAAIAALLWSTKANAESNNQNDAFVLDDNNLPPVDYQLPDWENMPIPDINTESHSLAAFLYMIRSAENRLAIDKQRYFRFYGNSVFNNVADHPVITGEKKGVPLTATQCRNAGFNPGCVSTAAGAYQINKPTWLEFRRAGDWGPYLSDFSPASQDEAARRILEREGALDYIESGDIEKAIQLVSNRWASLPGNTAKQGGVTLAQAINLYNDGLRMG